jgi:hypothetical protein
LKFLLLGMGIKGIILYTRTKRKIGFIKDFRLDFTCLFSSKLNFAQTVALFFFLRAFPPVLGLGFFCAECHLPIAQADNHLDFPKKKRNIQNLEQKGV